MGSRNLRFAFTSCSQRFRVIVNALNEYETRFDVYFKSQFFGYELLNTTKKNLNDIYFSSFFTTSRKLEILIVVNLLLKRVKNF